jgi:hypothetical protein
MSTEATVVAKSVARLLEQARFRFTDEAGLQAGIGALLRAGLPSSTDVVREHRLSGRDRVDFMVGGSVAVEVKIHGSDASVVRQLIRYAEHDAVRAIVLVTSVARHVTVMPDALMGKPLLVVHAQRPGF